MDDDVYSRRILTILAAIVMAFCAATMVLISGEAVLGLFRTSARLLLAVVPLLALAGVVVATIITVDRRRIRERAALRAASEETGRPEPVELARRDAMQLVDDVERAMESIDTLRRMPAIDLPVVAEALALADQRLPSLLDRHVAATTGANDAERAGITRHTLAGVIAIGRVCEEARTAAVGVLGDDVETEARYLSSRHGDPDLQP